jgi:hypothetical protein
VIHRFVELLWQLSAHALREVHKRTFTTDVTSNPLPASLADVVNQSSHASALLTVTKVLFTRKLVASVMQFFETQFQSGV